MSGDIITACVALRLPCGWGRRKDGGVGRRPPNGRVFRTGRSLKLVILMWSVTLFEKFCPARSRVWAKISTPMFFSPWRIWIFKGKKTLGSSWKFKLEISRDKIFQFFHPFYLKGITKQIARKSTKHYSYPYDSELQNADSEKVMEWPV